MPRLDSKRWTGMMTTAIATAAWSATTHAAPLPDRVWGTYIPAYTSAGDPRVQVDAAGNLYVVGRTYAPGLATAGAHKEQPDSIEVYLLKFDPAGERIWGTYFGGPGEESVGGLAVAGDTVALCGGTSSEAGIASPGAFQTVNGGTDGFVATFTLDGEWSWGTFAPWCRGIAVGSDGTVDVSGYTSQSFDIATPDAHQVALAGGDDAFLLRLGLAGERLWGTFLGGESGDYGHGVARDDLGGTYLVGTTNSLTGISTPGAFQEAHAPKMGGSTDGFVARFTDGGVLDWGTYFGGPNGDNAHVVATHPGGGVVFAGITSSPGLATPGTHQQAIAGSNDAHITRLDAAGTRLWTTYFGGEQSEPPMGIAVDALGSILIAGTTTSATGIVTVNAYQTAKNSNHDAYVAKFDDAGHRLWGTYFGGESQEFSAAVAVHGPRVTLAGRTWSEQFIATADALFPAPAANFLASFTELAPEACAGPRDCGGAPCVDGMCCDTACGDGVDDCQACSVAMGGLLDGHCSPSAVGQPCADASGECDAPDVCTADSRLCQDADLPDDTPCSDGLCQGGLCTAPDESTGTTADDTTADQATASTSGDDTTGDLSMGTGSTTGDSAAETGSTTVDASSGDLSVGTGSTSAPDPGSEASGDGTGTPTPSDPSSTSADPPTSSSTDDVATGSPTTSGDSSSGPPIDDPAGIGCDCSARPADPTLLLLVSPLLLRRRRSIP